MKRDFLVDQGNALTQNGRLYELKNYYDFSAIKLDILMKEICLSFLPHTGYEMDNPPLNISFFNVTDFNIHIKNTSEFDEVGFKENNNFDLDYLSTETQSVSGDHIVFRFTGDNFIRLYSATAALCIE